jgi:hypothetical protein
LRKNRREGERCALKPKHKLDPLPAAALAALCLLAAPLAAAQAADPAALAGQAAQHCRSGDLGAASAALRELLAALEASLGSGHDASHVVRLNLAHVERARGDERAASQLEALPEGAKRGSPDKQLKRALRKLRACAAVRGETRPEAPEIASKDQVNLARNLLNRGKYREALTMVNDARKNASASGEELMRLYETLALIELQLGHTDEALRAASAAGKIARPRGDVELRITLARLTAQLGDLDQASQQLDALEGEARSKKLRAELEEASSIWNAPSRATARRSAPPSPRRRRCCTCAATPTAWRGTSRRPGPRTARPGKSAARRWAKPTRRRRARRTRSACCGPTWATGRAPTTPSPRRSRSSRPRWGASIPRR